jgi:hypothetical protein
LLATVTFTGETASGWQSMNFGTPVSITAGTTYVASYHTNAAHISYNDNFFPAGGIYYNLPLEVSNASSRASVDAYCAGLQPSALPAVSRSGLSSTWAAATRPTT